MSKMRRIIAQRMAEGAQTTAPVTLTTEADATDLVSVREQFKADAVEMKLFASEQLDAHAHEPGPALFRDFLKRARPNCGQLEKAQLEYLFGPQAGETGSAALIPLAAPPMAGVLAIGSRDPDRFHPGKSVDFLQRLAEVVSAKLQSASSPGI